MHSLSVRSLHREISDYLVQLTSKITVYRNKIIYLRMRKLTKEIGMKSRTKGSSIFIRILKVHFMC
jgi:hypothetical protein